MYKKRIAIIDQKKCKPKLCGEICIKLCPMLRLNKKAIYNENDEIKIEEGLCSGCGICSTKCPFDAIKIINLELNLDNPLHQYGENRFRLFRFLELPKNGNLGIIGQNGIGKSTIIKILAGQIIPNMGDYKNNNINYENIINFYKGKENQKIFLELKNNNFDFAYKPQNIELIPKTFSGTVLSLLKKCDKKDNLKNIIIDWNLENILDKDIKFLSGGELQKVAIVATVLKNANLSFFDEPSSFLDIKQRFLFAKNIQNEKKNIIIEHDLAILDYISDYINILFGKSHAYGVVSHIKNTNVGINEFLEGYIKDENLKFRNYNLNVEYTPSNIKHKDILFSYPEKEINLGNFNLKYKSSDVYSNQIIGILGENGTGKTTFIKDILKNNKNNTLKFAYKPQSLSFDTNIMNLPVFLYLKDGNQEILKELWDKLNIERIKNYKLSELNGGDLQKVIVCKTLCEDANVYLIDEPSAFLDVEERLNVAKVIRNVIFKKNKIAFVIDHDILFIDFISDNLLIFDGLPGKEGRVFNIMNKKEGMNLFLKKLNITYRKDPITKRPRINKIDSSKDKEQKNNNNFYEN